MAACISTRIPGDEVVSRLIRILVCILISNRVMGDGADGGSAADWSIQSDWWPDAVTLVEPYIYAEGAPAIPSGRSAVLIRVEPDAVLVDFGREGVLALPFAVTDLAQSIETHRNAPPRAMGIFTSRLCSAFFRIESGSPRRCYPADFADRRYVLLVMTDLGAEPGETVVSAIERWYGAHHDALSDLLIAMIPLDASEDELMADVQSFGRGWPVMHQFLSAPYRRSYRFDHTSDPALLLIDDNGRILSKPDSVGNPGLLDQFLERAIHLLAQDRGRRFAP